MVNVTPEQLSETITNILEQYNTNVVHKTKTAVQESMKELVAQTKATAPKKKIVERAAGTYAKNITSKVNYNSLTGYSEIWYVKSPEHALTHLLNSGHALRQGGRWDGTSFVSTAAEEACRRFETRVSDSLKNNDF